VPSTVSAAPSAFALGCRRVLAQPDARVKLGRRLPYDSECEGRYHPERHPALLGADLVLENPRSLSAAAQAEPEAGNVIIEIDRIRLAGRQGEVVDHGLGESHGGYNSDSGKDMGKSLKPFRAVLCGQ
jgi:hypothetical protein